METSLQTTVLAARNTQQTPVGSGAGLSVIILQTIIEISKIRKHSHSEVVFGLRALRSLIRTVRHPIGKGREILIRLGSFIAGLSLFTGMTAASIMSTNIVLGSVALCFSPTCGWYFMPSGMPVGRAEIPATVVDYFHRKGFEAAAHEARCSGNATPAGCDALNTNAIPHDSYNGIS